MYRPKAFEESRLPVLHAHIDRHPFAAVVAQARGELQASHVPLILDRARGEFGTLLGHIARANPLWTDVAEGSSVLAIFQGVDRYISPRWYPSKLEHGKVVPTWNYTVVHASGPIRWFHDRDRLRALVEALTSRHEGTDASAWRVSDAPHEYLGRMLAAIVGFEIAVTKIAGQFKLSQNRSASDRAGVHRGLADSSDAAAQFMAGLIDRAG